jgi:hypothetical protein
MSPPQTIALFYDGFERQAADGFVGQVRSHLRRAARYSYRSLRRKQVRTGFYTAFLGLVASLKANGVTVRINDFAYARAHPKEPIGIGGYPSVIQKVALSNPIIFGPGDYGSGAEALAFARRENVKVLTQPCQWAVDLNRQWAGDKGETYFAGIDTDVWYDRSQSPKTIDFLVYDKIRWHRDTRVASVLERSLEAIRRKGMTYRVVRYGHHHISEFRAGLSDARALLFLCEHETQGIAYQEALASGLPVLAWDDGVPVDPNMIAIAPEGFRVSAVPYFDARCGKTFALADMESALDAFVADLPSYRPREYVLDALSLKRSGQRYLELYDLARQR